MDNTNDTPTRLLLVRHGESTSNRDKVISGWSTEVMLTELGREQAARTGEALSRIESIDALFASPLPRAWETATIIGEAIGMTPVAVDDLREINVGTATGSPLTDLRSLFPQLLDRTEGGLHIAWPEGESHAQLRERALRAIEEIVAGHAGKTVVAVAHGGPLAWIVTMLASGDEATYEQWRHSNCAISELLVKLDDDGIDATLVRFNDCAHLTPD